MPSVSFGYKKGKWDRTYDQYVNLGDLTKATRIIRKNYFDKAYDFGSCLFSNLYLIDRCIMELTPTIKYLSKDAKRYDYEKPEEIRFTTEPRNVSNLRGLLAKLKLPFNVPLKNNKWK